MVSVKLPDGAVKQSQAGISWKEFVSAEIGEGLARNALAVIVDGQIVDMSTHVTDASITVVTASSAEALELLRHSTAHIMADAVTQLFPGTKVTIGPSIDNGFYYDFDSEHRFVDEDLTAIQKKMKEIVKAKAPFERSESSAEDAKKLFGEMGETYKVEIIEDLEEPVVSLYRSGSFVDLCRGPHIPHTGFAKVFKLLSIAGAYWRGDEKNKMLQRIYGTAFFSKSDLKEYLDMLQEARERDHRKVGKELDLFEMSDEVGPGLALWTPKGGVIRTAIENFWRKEHYRNGYDIVYTPHIGRGHLWETSGHLDFYRDGMYSPMAIDGDEYYAKPMNCPFHIVLYKRKKWSYREFPFRWAELGTVYRYEKSGSLNGLKRVRGFTQDDAHLFCRIDQLQQEIETVLDFSIKILENFEFKKFKIFLSTRPKKFVGEVPVWDRAEAALEAALKQSGVSYEINPEDGAFYGPKIDINVTDSIGRDWQLSTIQVDFNLPERFDMSYIGSDGQEHRPIMIHRALLGSIERFFGVLIEHFKGAFPVWLSPVQVSLIPVADRHEDTAKKLALLLRKKSIRVEIDGRNEKIGYKVREQVLAKVPYVIVIGDKELSLEELSVRMRGGEQETMLLNDFLQLVDDENRGGEYC